MRVPIFTRSDCSIWKRISSAWFVWCCDAMLFMAVIAIAVNASAWLMCGIRRASFDHYCLWSIALVRWLAARVYIISATANQYFISFVAQKGSIICKLNRSSNVIPWNKFELTCFCEHAISGDANHLEGCILHTHGQRLARTLWPMTAQI